MTPASLATVTLLLLAAPGGGQPDAGPVADVASREGLLRVLPLLPLAEDPVHFSASANEKVVRAGLEALSQVRHAGGDRGDVNRALKRLFDAEAAAARAEFGRGEKEPARYRVIGLTRLCLDCHVRVTGHTELAPLTAEVDRLGLTPLQRVRFFAATRQFPLAEQTLKSALAVPPANEAEVFDEAALLRTAVGAWVRLDTRPADLVALLEPQSRRTDFPPYVQRHVKQWLADARAWSQDKQGCAGATPAKALARAEGLLTRTKAIERVVNDAEHLVPNLRAAACAQVALEGKPRPEEEATALFFLAVASSAAAPAELWQLDALYLERCVEVLPHSAQARACVARLVDRLGYAYSGIRGLPDEYARRLTELRGLAAAK